MAHGSNFRTGWLPGWLERLYDPFAHALTVITEEHRLAHDGMMFNATGKVIGLAVDGVEQILLNTGSAYVHMNKVRLNFGSGDIDIESFKDVVTSADGTVTESVNTNQNSSNPPIMIISEGPTVTDGGTSLHLTWAPPTGAGIGNSANGISNLSSGEEWILKPNSKYLITITNNSGAIIDMSYDILWYEISYSDAMGAAQ